MRIYQNEQIGDIYRILRGNLEDSIDNFNTAIKETEIAFLKDCDAEECCIPDDKNFIDYLENFYLILDETDSIILSYYDPLDQKSYSITFTISLSSKVSNSIDFYDKMLKVLNFEFLKDYDSYCDMIFLKFETLKSSFIAFADL